ncbi:MAG: tetratricopeptide repeat protein [Deltaproteobacteria bacterium]|nr:tetratricopeptide repeat protein [Deltaproteobacteria bacterium]
MTRGFPRLVPLIALLLVAACASSEAQRNRDLRREMLGELVARRDWSAAFPVARQLLEDDPDDALALACRGAIYRERLLFEEAEADLKKALRLNERLAYAHSALAVLYDVSERRVEAERHHRRAVELEPQNPEYLNNLGFSLYIHGQARQAIPFFKDALRIDPNDRRAHNNLGFAYAQSGDLARAWQHFQLGGSAAEAANNLGFAYERQHNLNQAYQQYAAALRLDPTLSRARRNLEHVAGLLGRALPEDLEQLSQRAASTGE